MSELYLPSSLVEELAEERVKAEMARVHESVNFPISFTTPNTNTTFLGTGPTAAALLEEQQGWAQIAVRAIEDRVSGLNWGIGRRTFNDQTGKWVTQTQPRHIGNELLNNPNPIFSGRLLKMLIAGLVAHTGAAYLQKIRDPFGTPVELWPLPTQHTRPIAAHGKVIGAYEVTGTTNRIHTLPEEDVIRIWRPDLKTLYGQLGMLGPQAIEYDARKAMNDHLRNFFEKDATPRVALLGDADSAAPDPDDKKRFAAAWRQMQDRRVGSEIGVPAFIPPGFKLHEFRASEEAINVPLEDHWARQVMAGYGVPLFAVGIDTNVNRATGETTMWAWDQNMVQPLTSLISDAFTHQMAVPDWGPDFVVEFEQFVSSDKEFQLKKEEQRLDQGLITVNEIREDEGAEAVEWGDLPRGNIAETPYTGEERTSTDVLEQTVNAGAGGTTPQPESIPRARVRTSDRELILAARNFPELAKSARALAEGNSAARRKARRHIVRFIMETEDE